MSYLMCIFYILFVTILNFDPNLLHSNNILQIEEERVINFADVTKLHEISFRYTVDLKDEYNSLKSQQLHENVS